MEKAKLALKSRVHEEERMDKSAKDLDPDHVRPNLVVPALSSRNSSSPSSPQPLPPANDDKTTDLCNSEMGDRRDLDDASSGRDVVVLDVSRTFWSQPSSKSSTLFLPNSDSSDDDPVRKKHKPDVEVITSRDETCQSEEEGCGRTNQKSGRTPSLMFSSKNPRMPSEAPAILRKPRNPRLNLRGHIMGYARTGSQISVVPKGSDLSEEEEEEDVDQLMSDAVEAPCDLPTHGDTSASVPDKVVDNVPGPPIRTSDPVDLTLDEDDDVEDPSSLLSQACASSLATSSSISHVNKVIRPEIIRSDTTGPDISLKFDIDHVRQVWAERPKKNQGGGGEKQRESDLDGVLVDAGVANTENDEKAVDALSRVIEKDDFATMDIVGQFNLGFIVVRLRKTVVPNGGDDADEMDDLFIVDQHAADEKYNFETLQSTTVIQSQKLMRSGIPFLIKQVFSFSIADENPWS